MPVMAVRWGFSGQISRIRQRRDGLCKLKTVQEQIGILVQLIILLYTVYADLIKVFRAGVENPPLLFIIIL